MFVCVRPIILLLLINFLDLSSSSSSSSQNATRPRAPSGDIDYYDEHEDPTTEPPSSSSTTSEEPEPDPCYYDMCVEQQQTCEDIAAVKRCLCPGLERKLRPGPPVLSSLTQQDDKRVAVQWCAPTSIVTHYIVSVKGKEKVIDREVRVEEKKRAAILQDVAAGALVCVVAVNKAGISQHSCKTFEPRNLDSGLALKLGIIGGVVGLIVLLILALLLWRHKKRRESSARNETRGVL